MYKALLKTAMQYKDSIAISYQNKNFTYSWLLNKIDSFANGLIKNGIKPDTNILLCLPNTPDAVIAFYAINKIGAIACLVHPKSSKLDIMRYLEISKSRHAIALDLFCENFLSLDSKFFDKIIISKASKYLSVTKKLIASFKTPSIDISNKNIAYFNTIHEKKDISFNRKNGKCSVVLFSGGSTGKPKGVCLSNSNFNNLARQILMQVNPVPGKDSMHAMMPIFHGFGLGIALHTVLSAGGRCILVPRFSKKEFISSIIKSKPNYIIGVPTFYNALLKNQKIKKCDLSFIKGFFVGGDKMSSKLESDMIIFIRNHCNKAFLKEGYGLTECVTACTVMPTDQYVKGSIGLPLSDLKIKIVDPKTLIEKKPFEHGEICVNGNTVMLSYLNNEEETKKALKLHDDNKIWLHTGDIGYLNKDGFLFFVQRLKRVIIKSGYNIYPKLLEDILISLPQVSNACVVPIEDDYKINKVKAYVTLTKHGRSLNTDATNLLKLANEQLSSFSTIDEIQICNHLPMTPIGKVDFLALSNSKKNAPSKEGTS